MTSLATYVPQLTTSQKSVVDSNGGRALPGDELEYRIVVENTGNDSAVDVVLRDPLPAGVRFVPGSLRGAEAWTDAPGDDAAEYDDASRTLTVRIGSGATAIAGGLLAPGASSAIQFRVTLEPDALGAIDNQGTLTARGLLGAPSSEVPTDGDPNTPGASPTRIFVDACGTNQDCSGTTPICAEDVSPQRCVGCNSDRDCLGNPAGDACIIHGVERGSCARCTNLRECPDPGSSGGGSSSSSGMSEPTPDAGPGYDPFESVGGGGCRSSSGDPRGAWALIGVTVAALAVARRRR